jgi:hypothetical protein
VRGGGEDRGRAPPLPARRRRFPVESVADPEAPAPPAGGLSRAAVSQELNLNIQTVRRFANAACAEELLGKAEHRPTKLDPYIDLVNQRWNEGVTNAEIITSELRALGFHGGAQAVRRYLKPFRPPAADRDSHHRRPAPRKSRCRASGTPNGPAPRSAAQIRQIGEPGPHRGREQRHVPPSLLEEGPERRQALGLRCPENHPPASTSGQHTTGAIEARWCCSPRIPRARPDRSQKREPRPRKPRDG